MVQSLVLLCNLAALTRKTSEIMTNHRKHVLIIAPAMSSAMQFLSCRHPMAISYGRLFQHARSL